VQAMASKQEMPKSWADRTEQQRLVNAINLVHIVVSLSTDMERNYMKEKTQ